MVFTLRDPRMEAISNAGSNFGSGLGDQLVKYVEGRQFNQALEGVDANTPLVDILKNFQANKVPMHLQEAFLSQQVQSRLAQERAQQAFGELEKLSEKDFEGLSTPQIIAKISKAFAQTPGGPETAGNVINSVLQRRRTKNLGNSFGERGSDGKAATATETQPIEPRDQTRGDPRKSESDTQAFMQGLPGMNQSQGQRQGIPFAPFTTPQAKAQAVDLPESTTEPSPNVTARPMRATDVAKMINQLATENPDMSYEDIVNAVQIQSGANKDEFDAGIKLYEQQEKQRQARQTEEDRINTAVQTKLQRDFPATEAGPGIDPYYESMMQQLTRYFPGASTDARYNKAKKVVTDLMSREQKLFDYQGRPLFGAYRQGAVKGHLDEMAGFTRQIYNDPKIPSFLKPQLVDRMRGLLSSRGSEGPVEVEYVINKTINPDFKKDMAKINALPDAPKQPGTRTGVGRFGVANPKESDVKAYNDKIDKGIYDLANFISKNAGGYMSPLLVRSALLKKGWTDEQVRKAYNIAAENGTSFSDYQSNQFNDLSRNQKPSLSTIFRGASGDKASEQDIWDVLISGRE